MKIMTLNKLFLLCLLLSPMLAQSQMAEYSRFMASGEREIKARNYVLAGKKFTAALEYATTEPQKEDARKAQTKAERLRVAELEHALAKAKMVIGYFGFQEDRAWAYKDGKFALIDEDGKRLTDFVFTDPQPFEPSGMAMAQKDGFFYLVDKQGGISEAYNYFIPTNNGWYKVRKGDMYTFLDRQGRSITGWDWYEGIDNFSEGRAIMQKDGKWGIVDMDGKMVCVLQFDEVGEFSEGLAKIQKDGKWGFVDNNDQIVIVPQFEAVMTFSEGLTGIRKDEKWGFVDKKGGIVIAPQFDEVLDFSEGLAGVQKDGKWGFVDRTGQIICAFQFEAVGKFSEGLAGVQKDQKWGFMDRNGQIVKAPQFDEVHSFSEGLASVEKDGKWGFIDKNGKIVIAPQYITVVDGFEKGEVQVYYFGATYRINKKGEMIVSEETPLPTSQKEKQ